MSPYVEPFYDAETATLSYVVYDRPRGDCAIIDPVLDYEARSARTSTVSAGAVSAFVRSHRLNVQWLLETHAHADHLSAAAYLNSTLGGTTAIGSGIQAVQSAFAGLFGSSTAVGTPQCFDRLFEDGEEFRIGSLRVRVLHVPGHTPADTAYVVDGVGAFVGDTLFMPDVGTARCDFPGGDAAKLYKSARRLLALPRETTLFLCHDYPPVARPVAWNVTVDEQRIRNIHVRDGITEGEFVELRRARDATLKLPELMLPAVQINIRAGEPPAPSPDGRRYLTLPLDTF